MKSGGEKANNRDGAGQWLDCQGLVVNKGESATDGEPSMGRVGTASGSRQLAREPGLAAGAQLRQRRAPLQLAPRRAVGLPQRLADLTHTVLSSVNDRLRQAREGWRAGVTRRGGTLRGHERPGTGDSPRAMQMTSTRTQPRMWPQNNCS